MSTHDQVSFHVSYGSTVSLVCLVYLTDRDKHIDILWENIKPEETHNFDKQSAYKIDSHGEPYDYASIMHYSSTTFSKNQRLKTIQPRKLSVLIGQRNQLSSGDIKQTNKLYKCPGI